MSDKNGPNGLQWNKTTTSSSTRTTTTDNKHVPDNIMVHLPGGIQPTASATHLFKNNLLAQPAPIYGGSAAGGSVLSNDSIYAAVRFQTPSLHYHAGGMPVPRHTAAAQSQLPPASVTVPGSSSGFVPPFPSSVNVNVSTTSVLTPNPFANVMPTSDCMSGGNISHAAPYYTRDKTFQHLNAQQQVELSKIMNAMSTAAVLTNSSTPSSAIASNHQHLPLTTITTAGISKNTVSDTVFVSSPNMPATATTSSSSSSLSSGIAGAIPTTLAESVLSVISAPPTSSVQSVVPVVHGRLLGVGISKDPDMEKLQRVQLVVESGLSEHSKQEITELLERISALRPLEKLMLYLRLPGDAPETDPLRRPQNPLGTRTEINQTINWVRTHLEHDPQVSIPKQDVYDDYMVYCERLQIKPLSTADFGKVMKQVFPGIRPRRLGTRGHSRYCYAAMRKTTSLEPPELPKLINRNDKQTQLLQPKTEINAKETDETEGITPSNDTASWSIIQTWAEKMLHTKIHNIKDLANCIVKTQSTEPPVIITSHNKSGLTQRELLKEKRLLTDMGPLKKRRKKKRKGSSSSEGSPTICTNHNNNNNTDNYNNNNKQLLLSPVKQGTTISEDEQKPTTSMQQYKLMNMKKEIDFVESPKITTQQNTLQQYQQIMPINLATEQRSVSTKSPSTSNTSLDFNDNYACVGENIVQCSTTIFNTPAVRNLTPKILQMSMSGCSVGTVMPTTCTTKQTATTTVKEEIMDEYNTPQPTIYCKKVLKAHQTKGIWINSPNVQKTITTTTTTATTTAAASTAIITTRSSSLSVIVPSIITTIASPPPRPSSLNQSPTTSSMGVTGSVIMGVSTATNTIEQQQQQPPQQHYLMGPPAHMANSISTSPIGVLSDTITNNVGPKVASRNMLLLRAKRQIAMAAAAAASSTTTTVVASNNSDVDVLNDEKDTGELPENLGLPRERVISICNMDKHELDDYFLPVQEEDEEEEEDDVNSGGVVREKVDRKCGENIQEDQESELLQYFQMGDAEEKLNKNINYSLDAAINNNNTINNNSCNNKRYPTATTTFNNNISYYTNTITATTNIINKNTNIIVENEHKQQQQQQQQSEAKILTTTTNMRKTPLNVVENKTPTPTPISISSLSVSKANNNNLLEKFVNEITSDDGNYKLADNNNNNNNNVVVNDNNLCTTTTFKTAVGSASASLALLSQKHQLQQQQLIRNINTSQTQQLQRKINIRGNNNNNSSSSYYYNKNNNIKNDFLANDQRLISARKNRIFVPISPNINSITTNNDKYRSSPIQQQQQHDDDDNNNNNNNNNANSYFASPVLTTTTTATPLSTSLSLRNNKKINASTLLLLGKQQSLDMIDNDDCCSSDPMIGANRRKRSYMTTSASAPPSPSIFQQRLKPFKNLINDNNKNNIGNTTTATTINVEGFNQQQHHPTSSWLLENNIDICSQENHINDGYQNDATIDQNSLDLDFFNSHLADNTTGAITTTTTTSTTTMSDVGMLALLHNNASETQRSQSVPLSQLQRIHSPFNNNNNKSNNNNNINQNSVENNLLELNNDDEKSVDKIMIKTTNTTSEFTNTNTKIIKVNIEADDVVASDTTALLDDVDYSVMLGSPDFMSKFESLTQTNATTSTTCSSSAGSSSGYSSSGGNYCNISSRSVPSTPLPHHQNLFGYYEQRRCSGVMDDCLQSSPVMCMASASGTGLKYSGTGSGFNQAAYVGSCSVNSGGSAIVNIRGGYDISKSMPTTPITTPCFRYSPSEFSRDFLINGNTLDSLQSFGTAADGTTSDAPDTINDSQKIVNVGLNVDSLIDDNVRSVSLENFDTGNSSDTEAIMVGAGLLDDF